MFVDEDGRWVWDLELDRRLGVKLTLEDIGKLA